MIGVGKTTTLIQHLLRRDPGIQTSRQTLYVPVDHFAVRNTPLYEIARDFVQQGGRRLYVDEIHKYPEWSRDLKSMHETFPDLTVVASGSSMMQIRKGSHDLSRRAVVYRMTGMSFRGMVFEVVGRNKTATQIREQPNAYLAIDGIETGVGARIPLWVFGFLY